MILISYLIFAFLCVSQLNIFTIICSLKIFFFFTLLSLFAFVIVYTDCLYVSIFAHFPRFKVKFLPQINLHFLRSHYFRNALNHLKWSLDFTTKLTFAHITYTHRYTQLNFKKYYA